MDPSPLFALNIEARESCLLRVLWTLQELSAVYLFESLSSFGGIESRKSFKLGERLEGESGGKYKLRS